MADDKINITYETLFELLRNEKNRDDLQKLPQDFFEDVKEYFYDKQNMLKSSQEKLDMFSEEEKSKTTIQIVNIKRILREIYDKRERKIVVMALNKARTNTSLIDTSALTEKEKLLYGDLTKLFLDYRKDILFTLFESKIIKKEEVKEEKHKKQDNEVNDDEDDEEDQVKIKVVRFLNPVPKFIGKELEVYGPFDEEDVASLPEDIAELLIKKGRAEELIE